MAHTTPASAPMEPTSGTFSESRFLYEDVPRVGWGLDNLQRGGFRNVLAIDYFKADETDIAPSVQAMSEHRQPDPVGLPARRQPHRRRYLVARPVGRNDRWRVTTRKVLQFSDRAPYSNPTGGMDFGQLLNYLTPAAVTWWLESDFYESMGKTQESSAGQRTGGR